MVTSHEETPNQMRHIIIIGMGEPTCSARNITHYQFIHYKSHTNDAEDQSQVSAIRNRHNQGTVLRVNHARMSALKLRSSFPRQTGTRHPRYSLQDLPDRNGPVIPQDVILEVSNHISVCNNLIAFALDTVYFIAKLVSAR
jgi:hypothetical protein